MKEQNKKYKEPHPSERIDYEFLAELKYWSIEAKDDESSFRQANHSLWMLLFEPTFYPAWRVYTKGDFQNFNGRKIDEPTDKFRGKLNNEKINFKRFIEYGFKIGKLKDCSSPEEGRVAQAIELLTYIAGGKYPVPEGLIDALRNEDVKQGVKLLRKFREDFHKYVETGKFPPKTKSNKTFEKKNQGGRRKFDPEGKVRKKIEELKNKIPQNQVPYHPQIVSIGAGGAQYTKSDLLNWSKDDYKKNVGWMPSSFEKIAREVYKK